MYYLTYKLKEKLSSVTSRGWRKYLQSYELDVGRWENGKSFGGAAERALNSDKRSVGLVEDGTRSKHLA